MAFTILTYSLAVASGVVVLVGGLLAAWRLIPRNPANITVSERLADHDARIEALRLSYADLADKYETGANRAKGRKRKRDDDEPPENVVPHPAQPALTGKAALRQAAGLSA